MNLKDKVEEGWKISAEGYSEFIKDELSNEQKEKWTSIILENAPKEGKLKILDVGTGPGFFSTILSLAGHDVVGIDASEDMIKCAIVNAKMAGATPEFVVMDSHDVTFPDESFDMIISRNVVWTLVNPKGVYKDWLRLLKKGGRVLVFDADWLADCRDESVKLQREKDREEYIKVYGEPKVSYKDAEKARGWRVELPLASEVRPNWDIKTMEELGYSSVKHRIISDRVYDEERLLLNRSVPMFMVQGDK
ncbi:class I SAM-dependent methyltransferase [Alkaliphilus transvaalensis]|uniref:class I SAM-dependent methyltransferase n=1 Tax=Alkaliphilus transvaalensis TaxID=114628 RepID=UPI00047E914A|nr:class I SAM-dependent methyltransferase [Alkaliphilus transvaalensis]